MPPDNYTESKRIELPFSFYVDTSSFSREVHPMSITIEEKMKGLNIDEVPEEFFRAKRVMIRLQDNISEILATLNANYFMVKIEGRDTEGGYQTGIMYSLLQGCYELVLTTDESSIKRCFTNENTSKDISTTNDVYEFWQQIKFPKVSNEMIKGTSHYSAFSMKPPSLRVDNSPNKMEHDRVNQAVDDPYTFLCTRYFSILYSLNTPLSYFPKTTITRFKNLCHNDRETVLFAFRNMVLSIGELDERHSGEYGPLKLIVESERSNLSTQKIRYELESQHEFIKKNPEIWNNVGKEIVNGGFKVPTQGTKIDNSVHERKFKNILLELKIREAQLQILIIFELVNELYDSEERFINDNTLRQQEKMKQSKKQRSLVRRKKTNTRQKVVPTFLGMGVNVIEGAQSKDIAAKSLSEYELFISLNTLVDRICLWDTLLGHDTGSKDSSYGFIGYLLIPFFNKRLPLLVKYMADKVKELNIKTVSKARRSSKEKIPSKSNSENVPSQEQDSFNSTKQASKRFNKTRTQSRKRPTLSKGDSLGEEDLLPAISLKRSKSNIGSVSSRSLQRRQVNMSLNLKSFNDSATNKDDNSSGGISLATIDDNDSIKRQQSINVIGKASVDAEKTNKTSHLVVEATPIKPKITTSFQLGATPNVGRKLQFEHIAKTPDNPFLKAPTTNIFKTPDISTRDVSPSSASMRSFNGSKEAIMSSPETTRRKNSIIQSPSASGSITSSPPRRGSNTKEEVVASSPVDSASSATRRRKRPGEPIQLEDSPFFNSAF